ncbi:hypothetical protein HGA13_10810 [Nocardia speluncae]|uniref:Uncharacterized protein n=1 Tax=Nocardia speluncae TaxID=419477 RepID=A0A846XB86_9NOCA|nr:hypothetical protein [Nocardia speluncae]NKY33561.1 hypothetical protein [Nocardia speluncae]
MTIRRVHRTILLTAVAAATFLPFSVAPAVADAPFVAPEVTFAGTAPGTVTATLHNPNDRGQCWAEAGVGPENNHVFFGESKPESLANPGQTVETSLTGLEPGSTITARGGCADTGPAGGYVLGETVTVAVPGVAPATGSFGG